jgi:hypothetical protein
MFRYIHKMCIDICDYLIWNRYISHTHAFPENTLLSHLLIFYFVFVNQLVKVIKRQPLVKLVSRLAGENIVGTKNMSSLKKPHIGNMISFSNHHFKR